VGNRRVGCGAAKAGRAPIYRNPGSMAAIPIKPFSDRQLEWREFSLPQAHSRHCNSVVPAGLAPAQRGPRATAIVNVGNHEATMAFTIKINGTDHRVDVDNDTPLLWVLRDVLGMTGTKFGCGVGLCGACTVHIDGTATRSCITTIDSVGASAITTIEAIGNTPSGKAIQKAWLDLQVVQCGYCQSGQIMSATALLAGNAHPNDADIDSAMTGNVCRCGTYTRIRSAIKQAGQTLAAQR
jgi:isoquinoline 1-oxidoreductase alpha subunit